MIRQTNYRSFDLYLSETPRQGSEHFKVWLGSELRAKLALDDDVELEFNIYTGDQLMKKGKHTYFLQDLIVDR